MLYCLLSLLLFLFHIIGIVIWFFILFPFTLLYWLCSENNEIFMEIFNCSIFFVTSIATFTLLLIEYLEQKTFFYWSLCRIRWIFENLTVFDAKIVLGTTHRGAKGSKIQIFLERSLWIENIEKSSSKSSI